MTLDRSAVPRAVVALFAFEIVAAATFAAWCAVGGGGPGLNEVFNHWVYAALHVGVIALLVWRAITVPRERAVWLAFAAAIAAWLIGWIYFFAVLEGQPGSPSPSVSDAFWIVGFFAGTYAGIFLLLRGRYEQLQKRFLFDGVLVALALGAVGAAVLLDPILSASGGSVHVVATNLAYPLGDLFVLLFVFVAFALDGWRPGSRWLLLGGAFAVSAVADTIWLYENATGTYTRGTLVDALYPGVAILVALAAWQRSSATKARPLAWPLLLAPATASLCAIGVLVYGDFAELPWPATALAAATLVGSLIRMVATFLHLRDVEESKRQALAVALTDSLTGLGNRSAFEERLGAEAGPFALVVFDLRRLKATNDHSGYRAGDARIRVLAAALRRASDDGAHAYRVGGGEFALVLPGAGPWRALETAQAVQHEISGAEQPDAGAAAGIAEARTSDDAPDIMRRADVALLEARRAQRSTVVYSRALEAAVADPSVTAQERHLRTLATSLARAVDAKDSYTRSHCETVSETCVLIGEELDLPPERIAKLRIAGLLHDVGKIGIPDAILQKPDRLTADEFETMKTHPVMGHNIVSGAELADEAEWILHHHERLDGNGYPDGLAGEDIPLESRIILVADAFEAMTSDRPYRRGRPEADALAELARHAGDQFDPQVVAAFHRAIASPGNGRVDLPVVEATATEPTGDAAPERPVMGHDEGVPVTASRAPADPPPPRPTPVNRFQPLLAVVMTAAVGIAVGAYGLRTVGVLPKSALIDIWLYDGTLVASAALCLWRGIAVRAERAIWLLLGGALSMWTAGEVLYDLFALGGADVPIPSAADALWLAFYPLASAGLIILVRKRATHYRSGLLLSGLIGALSAGAVLAAIVLPRVAAASGHSPVAELATNLAYPLGDLLLLSILVMAAGLVGWRTDRAGRWLAASILLFMLTDSIYLLQAADGTYVEGTLLDVGWILAAWMLAMAAWRRPPDQKASARERWTLAAPAFFGLVAVLVLLIDHFQRLHLLALGLATAAVIAVIARMGMAFRENLRTLRSSRREASTDALTGLGNRRALVHDLELAAAAATADDPTVLALFDLDGFKRYNDTFGHPAGDALLERLGAKLRRAMPAFGRAYRMGGDEFCVLMRPGRRPWDPTVAAAAHALSDRGEGFTVTASYGSAVLPLAAGTAEDALRLADERMYEMKGGGRLDAGRQTAAVLLATQRKRDPALGDHLAGVSELAGEVGAALGLDESDREEVREAAALHDIGMLAIPDAIRDKPGPLDPEDEAFLRRHPVIGEQILRTAPALDGIARLVRSAHEHYDGSGYPDGLAGADIPFGARIVAVCDAFDAMLAERPYRPARTVAEALAELQAGAGTVFDPDVVAAFGATMAQRSTVAGLEAAAPPAPIETRPRDETRRGGRPVGHGER